MKRTFLKHRNYWRERKFRRSASLGAVFFAVSLVISQTAINYATKMAGSPADDIILDNIPVFNVDFIVNEVALMFICFVLLILILDPRKIPFTLKSAAVFVAIRSAFVILTHIGPSIAHSHIGKHDVLSSFNLGKDLFFSGHTGMPFLMALIFWDNTWARYVCIGASLVFGVAVLMGHLHYSIDVFAAFFITYAIFEITRNLFSKDYDVSASAE